MKLAGTLSLLCLTAGGLCLASCGQRPPAALDTGRELVNAAGLSADAVAAALRNGGDVNRRSSTTFGWTPLIAAIYHHRDDAVAVLLASGANVNMSDDSGQTPLAWVVQIWPTNTVLMRDLLQRGANPRLKNRYGSNAFDLARAQPNCERILEVLQTEIK